MHKCTYRSNTITRIRKEKNHPKEEGKRSIYSRGGGWRKQPVMIGHEKLYTTGRT